MCHPPFARAGQTLAIHRFAQATHGLERAADVAICRHGWHAWSGRRHSGLSDSGWTHASTVSGGRCGGNDGDGTRRRQRGPFVRVCDGYFSLCVGCVLRRRQCGPLAMCNVPRPTHTNIRRSRYVISESLTRARVLALVSRVSGPPAPPPPPAACPACGSLWQLCSSDSSETRVSP